MKETFPPNFAVSLHQHKNKETFYIKRGAGYFHYDGKVIEVRRGSIVAVPGGIVHGIETFDHELECVVTIEGNHSEEIDDMYKAFTNMCPI